MHFSVVTLFPEFFVEPLKVGLVGQAFEKGRLTYRLINPRSFCQEEVHKSVDDRPFGGGDGMVMSAEPIALAIEHAKAEQSGAKTVVLNFSPQGIPLSQKLLNNFIRQEHLILICGRYAGVDERVVQSLVDVEVSLGDFVLSGGEAAALCLIDGVSRLLPNILGNQVSAMADSFSLDSIFEAPMFTRPAEWRGYKVPEILMSGHHQKIEEFRRLVGLARAISRRPALVKDIEPKLLNEAIAFVKALKPEDRKSLGFSEIPRENSPWR